VGSKGTRLTRLYDANQGRDFLINNPAYPQYAAVDVFSGSANSTYNGLQATVRLQQFHGFTGFSTYTFSKSLDGASDGINFNFANAALPQDSTNLPAEKGPSTFDTRHRWTTAINYSVPTSEKIPHVLGAGWQLNSIITVQSGRPINIITDAGGMNFNYNQRPDIVPGINPILPSWTPSTGYLNPNAFTYPVVTAADPFGYFGTLGRDQIYGPGFWNIDFSTTKTFPLRERLTLQFRAEFFNIFNHPNFALPNNVISPGSAPAGEITQTPDVAQGNPGLGGGGPRVMQFALRLQFRSLTAGPQVQGRPVGHPHSRATRMLNKRRSASTLTRRFFFCDLLFSNQRLKIEKLAAERGCHGRSRHRFFRTHSRRAWLQGFAAHDPSRRPGGARHQRSVGAGAGAQSQRD